MSEEKKKIPKKYAERYIGYKFFKETDEGFKVVRVKEAKNNAKITCIDQDTNEEVVLTLDELREYTPLEPYGVLSVNVVGFADFSKDVVLILYKMLELKIMGPNSPYAICRQSIHDFFADLLYQNPENNNLVGVSCTRDNCPANIDFLDLAACDYTLESKMLYLYRDDTLDSILQVMPLLDTINETLENLLRAHIFGTMSEAEAELKYMERDGHFWRLNDNVNYVHGWCRDLKTLLRENNFMADFNSMCDIVEVDFNLENYLSTRESGVQELTYPALLFFDEVFKVNAVETRVIKYRYTIDLSKFNNTNYVFLRDNTGAVYLVVYLVDGEYLEKELEEKINKLDVTHRLQLSYFNKYAGIKSTN